MRTAWQRQNVDRVVNCGEPHEGSPMNPRSVEQVAGQPHPCVQGHYPTAYRLDERLFIEIAMCTRLPWAGTLSCMGEYEADKVVVALEVTVRK